MCSLFPGNSIYAYDWVLDNVWSVFDEYQKKKLGVSKYGRYSLPIFTEHLIKKMIEKFNFLLVQMEYLLIYSDKILTSDKEEIPLRIEKLKFASRS